MPAGKAKQQVSLADVSVAYQNMQSKKQDRLADNMKIAIGNDHAGVEMKMVLKEWLEEQGYEISNYGTDSSDSMDYPDVVHPMAVAVEKGEFELIVRPQVLEGSSLMKLRYVTLRPFWK